MAEYDPFFGGEAGYGEKVKEPLLSDEAKELIYGSLAVFFTVAAIGFAVTNVDKENKKVPAQPVTLELKR